MAVLGLDVGGTKLAAALLDEDGTVLSSATVATPERDVWQAVDQVLRRAAGTQQPTGIGIGSAGPIDRAAGTVSPLNIPTWRRFPLVAAVEDAWPGRPVRLAGDGGCMAIAEQRFGAGRGVEDLLGVVASTGVGGGVVRSGAVVHGHTGNAGHIGHVVVEPDGEPCACGGVGCLETVASGPAAVRWARARGWAGADGRALAAAAAADDPVAVAALARAGTGLGQALASSAALLEVGLVVLGGGFSLAGEPLWQPLREAVQRYARLGFTRDLRVVPAQLGAAAGVVGAAALHL
ncbi:ROK family protein [Rhodococcus sp. X156]|uniref:ROK family protein n=1 Tax=Rhodococcus sp. X156 TaxID=2499145 RepID=UPI000FDB989E|nr:ROK family protein [Rhodococcus sp. X156]